MTTIPKDIGEQLATLYVWAQPSSIPSPVFRNSKIPRGLTTFLWDIFQVGKGHPGIRIRIRNDAEWTPVLPDFKVVLEDNGITVEDVIEEGGQTRSLHPALGSRQP